MSNVVGYFDDKTNFDNIKIVQTGDDVMATAVEVTSEKQPFGTGRKMIRDITVIRGNEKLAGFGGLGQRPDPRTERGIVTESGSNHGGVIGQILPGEIQSGITSPVGEILVPRLAGNVNRSRDGASERKTVAITAKARSQISSSNKLVGQF